MRRAGNLTLSLAQTLEARTDKQIRWQAQHSRQTFRIEMNLKSFRDVHILQSWSCNVAFSEAKRYESLELACVHSSRNLSPMRLKGYPLLDLHKGPEQHYHNVLRKTCDLCSVYSAGCTTVMTSKIHQPNCDLAWPSASFKSTSHKRNLLKFTSSQDSEMDTPTQMAVFLPTVRRPKHPVPTSRHWRHAHKPGGTQNGHFSVYPRCSLCGFKIYLSTLGRKWPSSGGNVGVYKCFPTLRRLVW